MSEWAEVGSQFPNRLREAREKRGLNKKQLAELTNVTSQAIATFEATNGKHKNPRLTTIIEIAKVLEVSIDWLCDVPTRNATTPVEALLTVLDVFQPTIEVGDGKSSPFVTLSFSVESGENNGNELKSFISQYQLIQTLKETGNSYNTDTTDTINAIRQHLLDRYRHLPQLPDYQFVKAYEAKSNT